MRYTKQLEESGKFKLTIWPEHCVLGTPGHEVVDVLKNAIREWEEAQHKSATYINKVCSIKITSYVLQLNHICQSIGDEQFD